MYNIFYSWQSDAKRKTNHGFIEECLKDAIAKITASENKVISLLDGVRGESGTPPLADTILKRISSAHVYVADLSLVYASKNDGKRLSPNPNVLFELGYAVAELSLARVIVVINEIYGAPADLPFDLSHLRWPFRYKLPPDSTEIQLVSCKKQLTHQLEMAITAVLSESGPQRSLTPRRSELVGELSILTEMNANWRLGLMRNAPVELKRMGLLRADRVDALLKTLADVLKAATTIWELNDLGLVLSDLRLRLAGKSHKVDQIALEQQEIENLRQDIERLRTAEINLERLENEKKEIDQELAVLEGQIEALKREADEPNAN